MVTGDRRGWAVFSPIWNWKTIKNWSLKKRSKEEHVFFPRNQCSKIAVGCNCPTWCASNSICCCICTCRTDIALSQVGDGSNISVNAYIRTLYKQKANFTLLVHFVSNDDLVAIIMTIYP